MIGAIANATTTISNFASSADCASTLACLQGLGVQIERDGASVTIEGTGFSGLKAPSEPLDCGNSGTTMRLISGILAAQPFESVLIGDESLSRRPMRRVIDPLEKMGATVEAVDGHAPLTIKGTGELAAIEYEPPVASAQIKSCVLLAGLNADWQTTVIEKTPTRDHTERMLEGFGADISVAEEGGVRRITVNGRSREMTGREFAVPSDISSAAFLLVAASCLLGSAIEMPGVGLNPTRDAVVAVLKSLGANIEVTNERLVCGEPVGDLVVSGGLDSRRNDEPIRGSVIANLIDEIPVLAVFGTQIDGGLEIRDAAELRVKESDRIAAVVANLRKMGAEVEEFEDGLRVAKSRLRGAEIETFHDHRIAMAFGVAGLFAEGETTILGAECADVSFPGFFDVLARVSAEAV
ncbi:MAG: 3-phosphoshikimate 1-carboxyvinyltransferase [Pyrinomonadaceae bacterium]|nr:3-phosphoshikimate 1-carboxyvinyltransferase [Pyrinomonadaceae bacterium]